ncbi:MAG: hypothetical protein M3N07_02260 [Pseudomonadota bacterium]|nr:hypothetical protein [Pseudomonadota bacterium]
MKLAFVLVVAAAALAVSAGAEARERRACCVVASEGQPTYRGPCLFLPLGGGSFSVRPVGRRLMIGDTTDVSVQILAPGVADVRGLTAGGINSRWGEALRSDRDRACWIGDGFSVCAY